MLSPYTVLDFTDERGELGPMLLGDLGANVIRVELPGGGSSRQNDLSFSAFNRNKRSIALDPGSSADVATLAALIQRADFIFESAPDGNLAPYGIDFARAADLNPRIVFVCISPFGRTGPHANLLGNDLVIAAMGGPVSLQGVTGRAPVRISVPQVWRHSGVEAAAGAMVAHARMRQTGQPQFVDLSAQCVMTWTMLNAMDAHAIQGHDFERVGSALDNGVLRVELVHPTNDGYIVALPLSGVITACLDWMIADGVVGESFRDIDWTAYDASVTDPDAKPVNLAQGTAMCRAFFAKHSKRELFEFGLANSVSLAPVNTLHELLALEHLQQRNYWQPVKLPGGQAALQPGLWAKVTAPMPSDTGAAARTAELAVHRSAPRLDEHNTEIRAELKQPPTAHDHSADGNDLPFSGVTVTDFAWVGVGPISSKYLADHGAHVVRVESELRPDVLRVGGPYRGDAPGINRSQFFGDFNTSKQSLGLDMKSPQAIAIAKQLIAKSDVLIESFAPGAMDRMGLSYAEVQKLNPSIIMVSTCLMGQTGPASGLAGYGYHAAAIAGFYEVTGWPDQGPSGPWVAYTDTIAPRFVSLLLAAALDHKRRTGRGCYLDVAQLETALHFLSPELLELQVNQRTSTRNGNRSNVAAPQGCYPCTGNDQWCAIAVDTNAQWQSLCRTLGRSDWATDTRLATHERRLHSHDKIDAVISEWTSQRSRADVMHSLQAAGVPAGSVQRSADLLSDPQYLHRQFYHYMDHPEMGNVPYAGHQYQIGDYDNGPRSPAPLLGQHSYEVLRDMLGFSDEAIAEAFASGAVG